MSIWVFIFKRIMQSLPILVMVSIISFFLIRLSPVDPLAELKLNPSISKETLEHEKQRLGLDKPVYVQYVCWAKNFIKGDMGISVTGEKVSSKIKERLFRKGFHISNLKELEDEE